MKIAVIGLGSMGKRRIRLMQIMKISARIIGIDTSADRCIQAKKQYGIECFESLNMAMKQIMPDCVFICTSPLSHGDIINECLSYGCHIFTEINLVSDRYEENIALAKARGRILFVSSTPIYRNEMKKIKELVTNQENPVSYLYHVGQYLPDWHPWEKFNEFFVSNKRTNGCREILAIELPWMLHTFGDIREIRVMTNSLTSLDISYPDTYLVQMSHKNGTNGMFAVDVVCRKPVRKLEVYNEDLYIEWEGTPESLKSMNLQTGELACLECGAYYREREYSEFVNELAYVNEIQEFFHVIEGKQMAYTMEDDIKTLKYVDLVEGLLKG